MVTDISLLQTVFGTRTKQSRPETTPRRTASNLCSDNHFCFNTLGRKYSQAFNYTFMLVLKPSPIKFKPFSLKEIILSGSAGIFTEKMETHGVELKSHVVMTPVIFNLRIIVTPA